MNGYTETESIHTTFAQLWSGTVDAHADATFLIFRNTDGSTTSWTYSKFDALVAHTARFLSTRGVSRGDAVHLALKNSPAFIALWLAAARLGAWIVTVDPASTARDITSQLQRTSPVIGFCAQSRSEVYGLAANGLLAVVIELEETAADLLSGSALLTESTPTSDAPLVSVPEVEGHDRLAVMFTSGTTSAPKGVVLTQQNYRFVSEAMSSVIDLRPEHRWLVTLPLFHANAQFYCFGPAIAVGASVALSASFSASGWIRQAAELGATHASLFAAPIRMIIARRPADAPALKLEHVWFAQSLGESHYAEFAEIVGCRPRQLYGMTETTAVVTADMSPNPRHDVIGSPANSRTVELRDTVTGIVVEPGTPGVITVAGTRGVDLFDEYLEDPTTTDRTFSVEQGRTWLSTGDLAIEDFDGNYRFVGRIDDVIKVAGENVSLTEIEAALAQAPGILEVAVLAKPDPIRDQVPVAFVVARDQSNPPRIDQLEEWAARNLPPQSRPREWSIIKELPRTSVGKIRRFKLGAESEKSMPAEAVVPA